MRLSLDRSSLALKALSDPTRLRILALLHQAEMTVSDCVEVLGQSQPRLSRHLKLLCEAGLAARSTEGAYAYFRLRPHPLSEAALATLDAGDLWRARDDAALFALRARRERESEAYFAAHAEEWDRISAQHAPHERVERAVRKALPGPYRALLDVGTGTGRMLELLADRYEAGLGLDASADMLRLARTRLEGRDLRHARVRRADARAIDPLGADERAEGGFDAAIIHQVLHHIDRPGRVLRETADLMAPGGTLLVVDFAPHDQAFLKTDHHHARLGLAEDEMADWLDAADLALEDRTELAPEGAGRITVVLWRAVKRASSSVSASTSSASTSSTSSSSSLQRTA